MSERTTCLVAGGGPAGMVLGLLLARAGVEVTVLEKHADFLRDFRGDTVHPSTLQLLDELGLGERFAKLPQSRLETVSLPGPPALTIADFRQLKVPHPYVAMVPQWDLLDLLAEAGQAEPDFHLRMNTEVTELVRERGRVAGVRYTTADGHRGEIRADLVVGCDGRWSAVRRGAGLRPREFPVPIDTWWFRLPREAGENPALMPEMHHGQFAVLIPREDYFQIAYLAPKGFDARLRAEGVDAFRERVRTVVPALAGKVDAIESMDDVKHLDVRLNLLPRWHREGVLCIGDAAHAMSPIGGVGINLAVQDAVATARLLAEPLRRGRVTGRELARVRRRRLVPTLVVQAIQRVMHRAVIRPVIEGRREGAPKSLVRLMNALPAARRVPAYVIGVGLLPEHAPNWARR
ncbi:FAD-dependent oxidoreductase [Amycolatopsis thermophila]|uniref:2-polyprenyl-6-methoxyphenol hydroxylase-like FAD-dependent oxidoreductase n=1 Tax=Amycolatopsis thermophila TaxID=206084 RepID=A0ABU0EP77_9PSEU|nr:FAD-dependent oxidoreductase [Amycolatopsis thermophila]MDQ0376821.1 2-polyprenyl-6-methoxyphenol hydroxylase-like FAD-dependent oxidoreductase [Amycolatopsis thermophila]